MRILIVNQYFGGDQTPTGRMAYDLARAVQERGHQAVALAGPATYTDAGVPERPEGVDVIHLPVLKGGRLPRWGSYWAHVAARINKLEWDRAVLLTDPPFLLSAARIFRQSSRPLYWWTMDLYPEALAARGDLRDTSKAYRGLRALNEYGMQFLDGVIALGERQKQRLETYESWPGDAHCLVVPPWDRRPLPRIPRSANRFLKAHAWLDEKVALYAGNLGEAHSFEEVVAAARLRTDWTFAFVVRGARKNDLEKAAADVPNVTVLDYVAPDMTPDLLWAADLHLITMQPGWEGVVVPSKLYGALATDAPILFVGPPDADTAAEVARYHAGGSVPNDARAVAQAITRLEGKKARRKPRIDGPYQIADFVLRDAGAVRLPLAA